MTPTYVLLSLRAALGVGHHHPILQIYSQLSKAQSHQFGFLELKISRASHFQAGELPAGLIWTTQSLVGATITTMKQASSAAKIGYARLK